MVCSSLKTENGKHHEEMEHFDHQLVIKIKGTPILMFCGYCG